MDAFGFHVLNEKIDKLQKRLEFEKRARKIPNPYDTAPTDLPRLESEVECVQAYLHAIMRVLIARGITTEVELDRLAVEVLNQPPPPEIEAPGAGEEAARAVYKEFGL